MYSVVICKQAKKKLQALPISIRTKLTAAIHMLGLDPDDKRLDIKKLQGKSGYRLRVGQYRVIFEREDTLKIISIEKIGVRGDVYK